MRDFTRKVLLATAPVLGTVLAIALLQAAHVPFPPALSSEAWPQWAIFAAVVHTCTALCMALTARLIGDAPPPAPVASRSDA